jgi:hypothetical protein
MIDLFINLGEKLLELAREKQKMKRSLLDDFIAPLMKQFEDVHDQYILSYKKYRELIYEQQPEFDQNNAVFKQLDADIIFNQSSRDKLFFMTDNLRDKIDLSWPPENSVDEFIMRFIQYLSEIGYGGRVRPNVARTDLRSHLYHIAYKKDGNDDWYNYIHMTPFEEAEKLLMAVTEKAQNLFALVQQAYNKVKADLLK